MKHTLEIVQSYKGDYEATLLLNCLVGLLIVPKEKCFESIPEVPAADLFKWGISPTSIQSFGKRNGKREKTLRGLVHSLRLSVAHSQFSPHPQTGAVTGFTFEPADGFKATIDLKEMKVFVERVSWHIHDS